MKFFIVPLPSSNLYSMRMASQPTQKTNFESIEAKTLIFDVRTPAEFEKGHIPGAINLPLFSNEERVEVGTTYKQVGRRPAIMLGLDLIGPKMSKLVHQVEVLAGSPKKAKPFVIHCWRGGMRSGSLGWLLDLYGFDVSVLDGGYKAYRAWVRSQFERDLGLIVIGGHTGSGKTLLLEGLKEAGESVVDLEGLANHRGSAFGSLGLPDQPTQQQFENNLAQVLSNMDDSKIWIEDEGRTVGNCKVPNAIFDGIRDAKVIFIEKSVEARLDFLVEIYGEASVLHLAERFENIQRRIGSERLGIALKKLKDGDIRGAAEIALAYYDKSYTYGLSKRNQDNVYFLKIEDDTNDLEIVNQVTCFRDELEK